MEMLEAGRGREKEALERLLRAPTDPERAAAAYQLRRCVARAAREISGEAFGRRAAAY